MGLAQGLVAVRLLAGAVVLFEGLTGAGGPTPRYFTPMAGKLCLLLVGGLSSLPHGIYRGLLESPHNIVAGFP